MTASFYCCGTFPSRHMRVVSRWSSSRMVRSCWSPSFSSPTGRPSGPTAFAFAIAFIAVPASSDVSAAFEGTRDGLLWDPLSLGCQDLACRISRSVESRKIAPISRGYALCLAEISLPRHGRTVIRPSSFFPAAWIRCFEIIHVGLPCATASPTQRREARKNERLLHFALSSATYIHA